MIKPRLWPWIEFFSSGGQESQRIFVVQQQPFNCSPNGLSCTTPHGTPFAVSVVVLSESLQGTHPQHLWMWASDNSQLALAQEMMPSYSSWPTQGTNSVCRSCTRVPGGWSWWPAQVTSSLNSLFLVHPSLSGTTFSDSASRGPNLRQHWCPYPILLLSGAIFTLQISAQLSPCLWIFV